jgi:hypothetical protein
MSMLACVVPRMKWLHILPPPWVTSCSERIRRAREAGWRLILVDARNFPQRPLNNLLRLLQNNLDTQGMHCVLMLSQYPLPDGIKEEGMMLIPFVFSTTVGQYQHRLRDEEASMLVSCNKAHLASDLAQLLRDHERHIETQRMLSGLPE